MQQIQRVRIFLFTTETSVKKWYFLFVVLVKVQVSAEEFSLHRPALGTVESFLLALTHNNEDGRVLVTKHIKGPKKFSDNIKYRILDFLLLSIN
jgi:hypothetical protein